MRLEITELQKGGGGLRLGAAAPQQGLDAGQQFRERKRLDQVVVGTVAQTTHAILDLVARREHQHRHVPGLAQRGQDAETVHAGQHHIQQDQVVLAFDRQVTAIDAVMGHIDHIATLAQALLQVARQLGVVFDDEYAHERPSPFHLFTGLQVLTGIAGLLRYTRLDLCFITVSGKTPRVR